ncbi:MAG: DUF4080 domain-containing protein [Bacillota bacterium]|jgi:radical SAM superfamily enzyme YgiQ (UPF0313 family)
MHIVLVSLNSKFIHSNLALRYLRAALRRQGSSNTCQLMEFQINDDLRRVAASIGRQRPDVLGFSCYLWNIEQTLALASDLKAVLPDVWIILGGPEAGARAAELLEASPAVDYVVSGEGERAFRELIEALEEGRPQLDLPGVWRRAAAGEVVGQATTSPLPPEEIPAPYAMDELDELAHKLVYYESSRGCPFRCSYCLSGGDRVRFLPLPRVFDELRVLLQANIPLIKFVDRTFNCHPERAQQIMEFLLRERGDSRFHFEICADLLDETMLDFLRQVPPGVFQFEIGIQDTDPETLQAIGRRMNWDKLAANVRALREVGNIHLHLDLIAGLPEQTWSTLRRSFDMVIGLRPHRLQLGFLKVLPGTAIAAQVKECEYQVSAAPPYEVLQSKWLSFVELNKLHAMEELLESYYNSGLLEETLPGVWSEQWTSPFDFFSEFADWWLARGHEKVKHGVDELLHLAVDFLPPTPLVRGLLELDRARVSPRFPATFKLPAAYRSAWESYLNQHLAEFAPRSYKQVTRSVFPVWLNEETLGYLGQPAAAVAVVDQREKRLHGWVTLGDGLPDSL